MYYKNIKAGLFVFLLLMMLLVYTLAIAAPMPPRPVINHQTRQCALIIPGDECGDVILPSGWEYLDESRGEKCPKDYTTIELYPEWSHFKAPHCCTESHSGVAGDCQDVVIHQSNKQCAFVEDIQNCGELPKGWEVWGKDCPSNLEWVDTVVCTEVISSQTADPTVVQGTEPSPTLHATESFGGGLIGTPAATETISNAGDALPCSSIGMVLVALIFAFRMLQPRV